MYSAQHRFHAFLIRERDVVLRHPRGMLWLLLLLVLLLLMPLIRG